jgi:tRNA threonylcarbamoyl adenosine modification protein YeaZ
MPQSCTLILETSTPEASLCIVRADGTVEEREFRSDRNHNAALFAPLQELLESAGNVGLVLVGSGPGSYSGTRVGIAAAQGVAIAMGCPAVAVPSVLAVKPVAGGTPCLVLGDARRGTYWSSRIDGAVMQAPLLQTAEAWGETMLAASADGYMLLSFEDPSRWPLPEGAEVTNVFPSARLLWSAWNAADEETRTAWQAQSPQPIYLKPPHISKAKPGIAKRRAGQQPI